MAKILVLLLLPLIFSCKSSSSASDRLSEGSSLSVARKGDILVSAGGIFSAGFFQVGINAYCFAVWFNEPFCSTNCTVVWMANRDQPVNGKESKVSLLSSGNLVLCDAGGLKVWATNTESPSFLHLSIHDNGNLVLSSVEGEDEVLWQSFNFPTDTLLPQQALAKSRELVSSRSQSNYSSGFYKLYFDNDNVLRLLYNDPVTSSIYWPDPELMAWEAGRSSYNNSRTCVLDSLGNFTSSDGFSSSSADYGVILQRRLTIDYDGNLRLYSRKDSWDTWVVSWQAMSQPCRIHGICGPNSICNYVPGSGSGRKCSCLPGFKMKDRSDWSAGCEPEFNIPCERSKSTFVQLTHLEFYGYDFAFYPNYTLQMCKDVCLKRCDCKGFQLKFIKHDYASNIPYCFEKAQLLNGHRYPNFEGDLYLRVPKTTPSFAAKTEEFSLDCSDQAVRQLDRKYVKSHENGTLKFVFWFACSVIGIFEFLCVLLAWFLLTRTQKTSYQEQQGYHVATSFRRFSYAELKKATRGFSEEIGGGAGGTVYKGTLSDQRVAAIKRLNQVSQGEEEFRVATSTFGRLNHFNLIETWGYCAEGKHRLLVYKYMKHGSLAENLARNALDWNKRFDIAVGTAKGLAYLHEECLEWVLHCDIKPQNILLDCNFQPKLSDFGLSKPLKRGNDIYSRISKIRGTRGYIAPEWVLSLPITAKVDVYSYGMVLLEMVTGNSPTAETENSSSVRGMKETCTEMDSWIEKNIDPKLEGNYDRAKMRVLVGVGMKCIQENRDARPTMSQVVEMLLHHENGSGSA
ncbi:hypothetical protein K2173_007214 [Erythroxylum novogranatense]|uniref:Receptor-like serine/threonine-protein kinase n=1 Tax=Erythroxylum novogranatense TaxID=1862640 RepID=A0AAV8T003_9ROSI|nr:hypothetical protein K2173_007214 [Erythroxylum novogranatense]